MTKIKGHYKNLNLNKKINEVNNLILKGIKKGLPFNKYHYLCAMNFTKKIYEMVDLSKYPIKKIKVQKGHTVDFEVSYRSPQEGYSGFTNETVMYRFGENSYKEIVKEEERETQYLYIRDRIIRVTVNDYLILVNGLNDIDDIVLYITED